jgi:iron complex outermembrane recepter protein
VTTRITRILTRHELHENATNRLINRCELVKLVSRPYSAGVVFAASIGVALLSVSIASGQNPSPPPAPGTAEVERVIVTGSNIPSAEEVGPNPVDTYRPADIEKLGLRNSTDLLMNLPQQIGATVNQNSASGGDGAVIPSLRGLLPKETLVLIDGKRVAIGGFGGAPNVGGSGTPGVDINLIPFPMIDHIDILKDGASAVYGSDAVAGVINIFLLHKFRGLEIGGSYGNTNLGASNDMGEWEGWLKAGTGDDKTDILIVADFYDHAAIYSRDRDVDSNAFTIPWGGPDRRSSFFPGAIGGLLGFRLIPKLFFSANSPPPHSAPNAATSPFYVHPFAIAPNAYPGPPGIIGPNARQLRLQTLGTYGYKGGGNYFRYNFLADTPEIPSADRQSFYGSFMRDICDKYLTVFADFKYTRSFFDAALSPAPFGRDAFNGLNGLAFSPNGISVPIQNPFNPFTVADATLIYNGVPVPVTTGVRYRAINDQGVRTDKTTIQDTLFDIGLRGEMGEFGDYFKDWNWELGFRYSRNSEQALFGGQVSGSGLREALLDTNPATAFNPFLGFLGRNSNAAISRVYVTLQQSGEFELPLGYFTLNGDLFNLPAGPVSFAAGVEYRGERWRNDPDSLSATFDADVAFPNFEPSRVNRAVWATYQEVRIPVTSPLWNFPGVYSLEFDVAEREEWYSQNTSAVLPIAGLPFVPAQHSQSNAQKPKFSVRWQPLDPKWIGGLTFRGSYTEAFHAPTLPDLSPAGTEIALSFPNMLIDPKGLTPAGTVIPLIASGNPNLKPEVAYEWTYGAVYSPKWIKGLTLSTDVWHIDLRSIASSVDTQFIINFENSFPGLVIRDPTTGAITEMLNPNLNLTGAIVEGVDYEGIYILDSSIFGHGDFGRVTFTLNGTYLSRFEFQATPASKRVGLSGGFAGTSFVGSLPHNRAYASLFYDGPADTWLAGFDAGVTMHYTGQYEDLNLPLTGSSKPQMPRSGPLPWRARKVSEWVTLDLLASYTFNLPSPASAAFPGFAKDGAKSVEMKDGKEKSVIPVSTAEYGCSNWQWWLNNTTISLGMQNVFDFDPPFVAGAQAVFTDNTDQSIATIKGRFWYVQLKKRF